MDEGVEQKADEYEQKGRTEGSGGGGGSREGEPPSQTNLRGGRRSSADFNPGLSTRLSGITAKGEELQDSGRR